MPTCESDRRKAPAMFCSTLCENAPSRCAYVAAPILLHGNPQVGKDAQSDIPHINRLGAISAFNRRMQSRPPCPGCQSGQPTSLSPCLSPPELARNEDPRWAPATLTQASPGAALLRLASGQPSASLRRSMRFSTAANTSFETVNTYDVMKVDRDYFAGEGASAAD